MKKCKTKKPYKYSFGGDLGKFMLNNAVAPLEGLIGTEIYQPEFSDKDPRSFLNIASKVTGTTGKIAGGLAAPIAAIATGGLSTGAQIGIQAGATALKAAGQLNKDGKPLMQFQAGNEVEITAPAPYYKDDKQMRRLDKLYVQDPMNQYKKRLKYGPQYTEKDDKNYLTARKNQMIEYLNANKDLFGEPTIKPRNKFFDPLQDALGLDPRSYYNPRTNSINVDSYMDIASELPHAFQHYTDKYPKAGLYDFRNITDDKSRYQDPTHKEYQAHKYIEPIIRRSLAEDPKSLKLIEDPLERQKYYDSQRPVLKENLQRLQLNPDDTLNVKYQAGGNIPTQQMLPYDPNHLDQVSENLIQMDGPTHSQGGIETPVGEFDKQETVLKQGVVGNETPFAFSDNLKLSKEIQKLTGLPYYYKDKTIADVSKSIERKYEPKYDDDKFKTNTKERMKKSLFSKLMQANKLESLKNKANPEGKKPEELLTFNEMNSQYQLGNEVWNKYIDNIIQPVQPKSMFVAPITDSVPMRIPKQKEINNLNSLDSIQGEPLVQPMKGNYDAIRGLETGYVDNYSAMKAKYPQLVGNELDFPKQEFSIPETKDIKPYQVPTVSAYNGDTYTGYDKLDSLTSNKENSNQMSGMELAGLGLKGLSQLGEFASLLGRKDQIPVQYNPYKDQVEDLMNQRVSLQPMINELNAQQKASLDRNNSRSWNTQNALNQNVYGQSIRELDNLKMQEQLQNNQLKTQQANMLNNLGQQDVQARNYQENLQAQTDANRRNMLRQSIGNVGNGFADYLIKRDVTNKTIREGMTMTKEMFRLIVQSHTGMGGSDIQMKQMFERMFPGQKLEATPES